MFTQHESKLEPYFLRCIIRGLYRVLRSADTLRQILTGAVMHCSVSLSPHQNWDQFVVCV